MDKKNSESIPNLRSSFQPLHYSTRYVSENAEAIPNFLRFRILPSTRPLHLPHGRAATNVVCIEREPTKKEGTVRVQMRA